MTLGKGPLQATTSVYKKYFAEIVHTYTPKDFHEPGSVRLEGVGHATSETSAHFVDSFGGHVTKAPLIINFKWLEDTKS